MPNFFSFFSYVIVTSITPGPNNLMSMANAGRFGMKKSMGFNWGVFAGFVVILAASAAFSSALYAIIPAIKPVLKTIGALYILWLAYKTVFGGKHRAAGGPEVNSFLSGMLLQFMNPKAILYSITVFSTFIVPYYHNLLVLFFFSVLLAFVSFLSTLCWALFGSVFQRFFDRHTKAVNLCMGLLLVYCAVSLFL